MFVNTSHAAHGGAFLEQAVYRFLQGEIDRAALEAAHWVSLACHDRIFDTECVLGECERAFHDAWNAYLRDQYSEPSTEDALAANAAGNAARRAILEAAFREMFDGIGCMSGHAIAVDRCGVPALAAWCLGVDWKIEREVAAAWLDVTTQSPEPR